MNIIRADSIDPETSEQKDISVPVSSFTQAQKMRAAIAHYHTRVLNRGTQPWVPIPGRPGFHTGNPSLDHGLGQYMLSLRRRKVYFACCIHCIILTSMSGSRGPA